MQNLIFIKKAKEVFCNMFLYNFRNFRIIHAKNREARTPSCERPVEYAHYHYPKLDYLKTNKITQSKQRGSSKRHGTACYGIATENCLIVEKKQVTN